MFAAFNTILVALDGRQGGLDAAALARELVTGDTRIGLAHVGGNNRRRRALDERTIEQAWRLARGGYTEGPCPPVLEVTAGSVAAGLLELVEAHHADLLVVGAHHHRHLHLLSHDHTRAALRRIPCPVAVAPRGHAARQRHAIRSVAVAFADDRDGRRVLDTARAVAWQLDAEVHATMIVPASNWPDAEAGTGWRAAAAARRMAEIPGVHGKAVEGEPHHVLAQMSAEVDLLVIGHHHHGALRRLVMSDVAESLADHSRCPLLVLPGGT